MCYVCDESILTNWVSNDCSYIQQQQQKSDDKSGVSVALQAFKALKKV
jgi:hypothetical protein